MSTILWVLGLFVGATALAFHKASLKISTGAVLLATLFWTFTGPGGWLLTLILWAASIVMTLLNIESLRQDYVTRPILAFFRSVLPKMSETERTALEAGTVWWEGELFSGHPNWNRFQALPKPRLSEEEQAFLDGPVEEFCAMLDGWKITHEDADLSAEAWAFLKKHKFFGMIIPKEYGGLEFSALAHSEVLAKIASSPGGATAASTVAVPNSLGPAELLLHYGTQEQKDHYLPNLAVGKEIPCFALTSPHAGSDAGAIPDKGVICKGKWKGKTVTGMKLTWDKRYITLAPVATVLGLAFKLYDPEHLLGDREDIGVTCALVPTNTPGVVIGRRHFPLNNPFQNGPTQGEEVFVPLDYIIGGEKMAGQGWRMLMECLAVGRSISLPSMTSGGAAAGAFATGAYARVRRQFNVHIGAFEGIQEALARIGGRTYATEAMRVMTAHAVDLGEKPAVPSAIAKYHCTDMAQKISIDAMDIHAGKGVMLGPSNYLARGFQGAPIAITVEGANILTRSMIIFGQGAIRCHPYVLREMQAANDEDETRGLIEFDEAFFGHIGHIISVKARSFSLGMTNGYFSPAPDNAVTRRCYQKINRYSANLAFMSDVCMAVLGGELKFRETTSARLGDVLARLYILSAALKRYEEDGCPQDDLPMLRWVADDSFKAIEDALDGVIRSLPAWVAWPCKLIVFPLGRHARSAPDRVTRQISELLQTSNDARDRLTRTVYVPQNVSNPLGLVNTAMIKTLECRDIEKRLYAAYKKGQITSSHPKHRIDEALDKAVIDKTEAAELHEAYDLLFRVISVDDFAPDELGTKSAVTPAAKKAPAKGNGRTGVKKTAAKTKRKAPAKPRKAASSGASAST